MKNNYFHLLDIIKNIPIFSDLNWYQQQKIVRKASLKAYRKGDVIIQGGAEADALYCVVSGRIQAYQKNQAGVKTQIEFIHRGTHFGVVALLTGNTQTHFYEALNDSKVLIIQKSDFDKLLASIPRLGVAFSRSLSKRMHSHVQTPDVDRNHKLIAVFSPIEQVGVSFYALNLATALRLETGQSVLLISFSTKESHNNHAIQWQSPVSDWLKTENPDHIKTEITGSKDNECPDCLYLSEPENGQNATDMISPLLSSLVHDYDYVVLDCSLASQMLCLELMVQSDLVHLLSSDQQVDLPKVKEWLDRLEEKMQHHFSEDKIKVFIRPLSAKVYLSFEAIDRALDYSVHAMLPMIQNEDFIKSCSWPAVSFRQPSIQHDYVRTVTRIAREIGEMLVGLVLGGGAALGVAHVGVIRALERENIPVDVVVGSSMGALIGGLWTTGRSADELETVAREFGDRKAMLKLFDPVVPISGLVAGHAITRWLKKHLGSSTFYSTRVPMKVIAYDLNRRQDLVIQSGSLVSAIRRSISIPGVLEPVKSNGRVIIDGGVLNPLPTNVLRNLGIKKIIAVNVLQSPDDVCRGLDMTEHEHQLRLQVPFAKQPFFYLWYRFKHRVMKFFTPNISDIIVRTLQASEYVIAEQSVREQDIMIHPDLAGINWFELYKVDELIAAGEKATLEQMDAIHKMIRRHK